MIIPRGPMVNLKSLVLLRKKWQRAVRRSPGMVPKGSDECDLDRDLGTEGRDDETEAGQGTDEHEITHEIPGEILTEMVEAAKAESGA